MSDAEQINCTEYFLRYIPRRGIMLKQACHTIWQTYELARSGIFFFKRSYAQFKADAPQTKEKKIIKTDRNNENK